MQETAHKRSRVAQEPSDKPASEEEHRKIRGEEDPGTAYDLAVPDYVLRDFGLSEKEDQDNGTRT